MQDYSAHKIVVHKILKEMQHLMLKNQFDDAMKQIDEAIVELRLTRASVAHLKEQVHGQHEG